MTDVYSIAEVVDFSNKDKNTIFMFLTEDDGKEFDEFQIKSLNATGKIIEENGATWIKGELNNLIEYINNDMEIR